YGPSAPASLAYRTKTIFAFETIDGGDVCFFGFMVQEYGNECTGPNHRCVYVSYLGSLKYPVHGDSVKGLSTKNVADVDANNNVDTRSTLLRTQTYHQILLGYLDYAKKLGYGTCYITAVPPMTNENYIFPRHPPSMKFPGEARLLKWYDELLKQAKTDGVVLEYSDLRNHVKQHNDDLSATLPFFDGDVRSDKVVEMINEVVNKSEEPPRKRSRPGNLVLKTLLEHLDNTGHLTLVLKLRSMEASQGQDIVDPDPLMPSTLLASCDDFIYYANEKCWEFSSLRRAQYTTQMIALTLHKERTRSTAAADDASTVSLVHCDICNFVARFSCDECEQDFCKKCASGHDHPLDAIEFMEPLDENAANQFFGM
ncbi:CRE-CBP-1 protein, partial [Aphelenchoides avenae]